MNFVAVVKFFLSKYGPGVKAGILGVFFHQPLQEGLSSITQTEKLLPDGLQAIADSLGTMDSGGIKCYHRSRRQPFVPYDQRQLR